MRSSVTSTIRTVRQLTHRTPTAIRVVATVVAVFLFAGGCSSSDDVADDVAGPGEAPALDEPTDTIEATVPQDELEPSAGVAAQEAAGDESGDFIDLPYWEVFLIEGFGRTQQPEAECARPSPDVTTCEYQLTGSMVATHIGRASEVQSGTLTTYASETCDGPGGTGAVRTVEDGTGTITSEWGDELNFRVRTTCNHINWVVEGGTGRFLDARGRMSGVLVPSIPGAGAVNTGTLTVRADLWEDVLPPTVD